MRFFVASSTLFLLAAAQDCSDQTVCTGCTTTDGCNWCQTRADPFKGTCGADACANDADNFPIVAGDAATAPNCLYQESTCADCTLGGNVWGQVGDADAACYTDLAACSAVENALCTGAVIDSSGDDDTPYACDTDGVFTVGTATGDAPPVPDVGGGGEPGGSSCPDNKNCFTCGADATGCIWCGSADATKPHDGSCADSTASDGKCPEGSTLVASTDDACALQAATCADCAAGGWVWGVYTPATAAQADDDDAEEPTQNPIIHCYLTAEKCAAVDAKAKCDADCKNFDDTEQNASEGGTSGGNTPTTTKKGASVGALATAGTLTAAVLAVAAFIF